MYKIIVEKECGCFKNSDLQNNIALENKDEALTKALGMINTMNNDFCEKHEFEAVELENYFMIRFKQEPKTECCGSGCCH